MSKKITADVLAHDATQFLAFKRAMGMGYRRAEFVLNNFVRFVRGLYGERPVALDQAVTQWATRIEGRKAITVSNEFSVVRQLCLFRRRSDPYGFVPDQAVAPVKESVFVPYIFSREEVLSLVDAATRHEGRNMWGAMLHALTLVLYCTGMRLGEAARLQLVDVDLRTAVLTVQRSKGRSRILAIRDDLVVELRQYLRQRQEVLAASGADDPLTPFIRLDGSALTLRAASDALRCLLRNLGLKPPRGRSGARPYEFRHAFAVHRLTAWALEGVDVHAKLPWCRPTSATRTSLARRCTSRPRLSCCTWQASDSSGTRAASADCHEPLAMWSVRSCAVVLHRVPAQTARCQRPHHPCLS